jgi:predicted dehydrogenase
LLKVDYCYRHVKGMAALRDRIRHGELGELLAADLTFHNAYGPSKAWCFDASLAGGGCVTDLGTHLIDLLLWLLEYPVASVNSCHLFAQGRRITSSLQGIEDFAVAELCIGDAAPARLACSWNFHAGRDAIIEVYLHGSKAGAVWRNVNGSFYDFEVAILHGAKQELLGTYPDEWGARALTAWIDDLHAGKGFDTEAAGLIQGAQLIDACYGRASTL